MQHMFHLLQRFWLVATSGTWQNLEKQQTHPECSVWPRACGPETPLPSFTISHGLSGVQAPAPAPAPAAQCPVKI